MVYHRHKLSIDTIHDDPLCQLFFDHADLNDPFVPKGVNIMTWPNIFRVCFSWIIEHLCKILWNSTSTIYFWPHWPLTPLWPQGLVKIDLFWHRLIPRVISFPTRYFTANIYFWPYWPLTPNMTPIGRFPDLKPVPFDSWLKIGLMCKFSSK
jgi:hypothetical protein